MTFVDLILPLPLPNTYTYEVPDSFFGVECGMRVVVQFGQKKLYTALISKVHQNAPENYRAKPILSVLDDFPVVTEKQLDFWKWIATYYCCHLGAVMNAAFPSGLKLSSETTILLG
ncbi:MAG: primosomal protein N', partial [Rhodobacteraceae bacterium]|nr:primosomal protein N' [Paracoccaceae bacterium]